MCVGIDFNMLNTFTNLYINMFKILVLKFKKKHNSELTKLVNFYSDTNKSVKNVTCKQQIILFNLAD